MGAAGTKHSGNHGVSCGRLQTDVYAIAPGDSYLAIDGVIFAGGWM
jgi:hypothetical protein